MKMKPCDSGYVQSSGQAFLNDLSFTQPKSNDIILNAAQLTKLLPLIQQAAREIQDRYASNPLNYSAEYNHYHGGDSEPSNEIYGLMGKVEVVASRQFEGKAVLTIKDEASTNELLEDLKEICNRTVASKITVLEDKGLVEISHPVIGFVVNPKTSELLVRYAQLGPENTFDVFLEDLADIKKADAKAAAALPNTSGDYLQGIAQIERDHAEKVAKERAKLEAEIAKHFSEAENTDAKAAVLPANT